MANLLFALGWGPNFILRLVIGAVVAVALSFLGTLTWRSLVRKRKESSEHGRSPEPVSTASDKPDKNISIHIQRKDGPYQYSIQLVDGGRSVRFDAEFPSNPMSAELNSDNLREFLINMKVLGLREAGDSTDAIAPAQIRMRKAIFETVKSFEENAGKDSTQGVLDTPLRPQHMFYRLLET